MLAELAALILLAARARSLARRLRGGRHLRAVQLLLLSLACAWLAGLPFRLAAHWWQRRYGISFDGYGSWLVRPWPALLAGLAGSVFLLLAATALERRLGRRWWLAGAPLLAAAAVGFALLQPVLLVSGLRPLAEAPLAREIRALAARERVGPVRIDVRRVGRRTTLANAEAVGIGPTRRVILWDTLLDGRFSRAQVRFVAAHELAHIGRRHVWKGLAWFGLLSVPSTLVLAAATGRRGGLRDPAVVPLAVVVVTLLQLALLPVANAVSRRYETEADWLALDATRDPAAAVGVFRRFATIGAAEPAPPGWASVLFGDHPTLLRRLELTEAWRRRAAEVGR